MAIIDAVIRNIDAILRNMEAGSVQQIGAPCGHHGPYTFYKGFKYFLNQKCKILSLGDFFVTKISKAIPVCIGELQLIWEDKNSGQLLCSLRLYFLPQNTPEGRQHYHGKDEILVLADKVVLKVHDLVSLITEDSDWTAGCIPVCEKDVKDEARNNGDVVKEFADNNCDDGLNESKDENVFLGDVTSPQSRVMILSYAQYCRYIAVMKRLETVEDKWLKNSIACALGGFTVKSPDARILFCRDTIEEYEEIDELEIRCDHLAPNLKGRPRKKRNSTVGSEKADSEDTKQEAVSINPAKPKAITRKDSVSPKGDMRNGNGTTREEQAFLAALHGYMKKRHTPIDRIPSLGFKQIDLYLFYINAMTLGGYDQITDKRLWKQLYDLLGGNPGSTSAATCTRRHYERLLLPFELYKANDADHVIPFVKHRKSSVTQKEGNEKRNAAPTALDKHQPESYNPLSIRKKKFSNPSLAEKAKKWEEIRRLSALSRDKVRKHKPSSKLMNEDSDLPSKTSNEHKLSHSAENEYLKEEHPKHVNVDLYKKTVHQTEYEARGYLQSLSRLAMKGAEHKQSRVGTSILSPLVRKRQKILAKPAPNDVPTSIHPHPQYPAMTAIHPVALKSINHSHEQTPVDIPQNTPPSPTVVGAQKRKASLVRSQRREASEFRPSVIQHTPQPPSTTYAIAPITSTATHHVSYPIIPAHSGHLKRVYPYADPSISSASSPTGDPKTTMSKTIVDVPNVTPYYHNAKRAKEAFIASTDFFRSKTHSDPVKSGQQYYPVPNDQPTDLSMKTGRDVNGTIFKPEVNHSAATVDRGKTKSPQLSGQNAMNQVLPRSQISGRSSVANGQLPKSSTSKAVRTYLQGRQLATQPGKVSEGSRAPPSAKPTLAESSNHLHPAFPQRYMSPQIMPSSSLPSPAHMHQLFEAQIRANVVAYKDMMRRGLIPSSSPPIQLHPHLYKDTTRFTYPK